MMHEVTRHRRLRNLLSVCVALIGVMLAVGCRSGGKQELGREPAKVGGYRIAVVPKGYQVVLT